MPSMIHAGDDYAHNVKQWHEQHGDGEHESSAAEFHDGWIVHGKFHKKHAKDKPECQTARVAHEYLLFLFGVTTDVEIEIGHQYTHQTGNQYAVGDEAVLNEAGEEATEGKERQTRCQSVDAIDEVDGIVDEDDHEDGERGSHPERDFADSEKAIEMVDV